MAKHNYYCIYARTSTERQAKEGSHLSAQVKLLREYAEDKGFKVNAVIKEAGTSKKALKKLKEKIRSGDYAGVICVSKDRIARTTQELVDFLDFIDGLGMELIFAGSDYKNDPYDRLMIRMMNLFREYEKEMVKEWFSKCKAWIQKHKSE